MYYISGFKKIDRKIYQIMGKRIGRAIPIKSIVYFILVLIIIFVLRHLPLINILFLKIPFLVSYLLLPFIGSYLLSDVESEKRTVFSYVRSVFNYHTRKLKNQNFYRGKLVMRPQKYEFKGQMTVHEIEKEKKYQGQKYKVKGYVTYR